MRLIKVMVVCAVVQLCSAKWREIVANEEELAYTCTATCEEIGVVDHQPNMLKRNCNIVKECKTLSHGWNKGFVRCDYCKCKCEDSRAVIPKVKEVVSRRQFEEPLLYGTCTGTCPKSGLVRTNYGGCKQVRDCSKARSGWLRGFVRCDYCTCHCVNHKYIASYRLVNVKYRLDEGALTVGKPTAMKQTVLENSQAKTQTITRSVSFTYTNSKSVSTTKSLTAGMSITVEAGVSIGVASVSTAITRSIEAGFESTVDEVTETSHTDSIEAKMDVDPGQQCEMVVIGNVMNIDVPYSATILTEYDDGSVDEERTEGVFSGVETSRFRVQYKQCTQVY